MCLLDCREDPFPWRFKFEDLPTFTIDYLTRRVPEKHGTSRQILCFYNCNLTLVVGLGKSQRIGGVYSE
jgi:hypothetical protein